MQADWARTFRDQCTAAGVSFFFKQWGECGWYEQMPDATCRDLDAAGEVPGDGPFRVGKKASGLLLDGCEWKQCPGVA